MVARQPERRLALGRALFFVAIKKPNQEWPNLYSTLKGDVDRLRPPLEDAEIQGLAKKFNDCHKILVDESSGLKKVLDTAIDSYKPLKGKCEFIG
ncbi:MAG: hypothetical protein ACRD6W_10915 [Nitrososphaerales archaeon]